jgi:hypothetical protein
VSAWDVPDQPDTRCIDVARYRTLLQRAVETVLAPIEQSVNGGKDSECLYLFPLNKAKILAEGSSRNLGEQNLSSDHNFCNGIQGGQR